MVSDNIPCNYDIYDYFVVCNQTYFDVYFLYLYIYIDSINICVNISILYTLQRWMNFASYFTQPPVSLSEAAAKKLNLPSFKSKKRPGASGPRMAQLLSCHDQRVRISMGGRCFAVVVAQWVLQLILQTLWP